jgi:iron complex outermembrane receptor protein
VQRTVAGLIGLLASLGAVAAERVEEIIVTGVLEGYSAADSSSATRTPTPLNEIPQSVSVLTGKLLADQQPVSIAESLRNVSGVVINNTRLTPAFDNTRIRGFAAEQFVDGFTQYYNPGDRDSLVSIDRIEVLKGTNGLLYGGGSGSAVGGIINIVSKVPEATPSRTVGVRVGSNAFRQASLDVNQAASDSVRLRLTGEYTESGSDVDVVGLRRYNVTPAMVLTNGSTTTVTARYRASHWEGQDYQGLPATGTVFGDVPIRPAMFVGPRDIDDSYSDFNSLHVVLDQSLGRAWSLSLQGRYATSMFKERAQIIAGEGFDFGADLPVVGPPPLAESLGLGQLPFARFNALLSQEQEEQSLVGFAIGRLDWRGIKNTLVAGADYSRFDDEGFINASLVADTPFVDLADPDWSAAYVEPGSGVVDNVVSNTVSGAYLQWQASLGGQLHLLAGLRRGTVVVEYTAPDNNDRTEKTRWLPRLGLVVDVRPGIAAFAGFSRGMRGQPFADFVTTPKPEESSQAEAGLKLEVGGQITGQLAMFTIKRENVAVPTPNPEEDGGFGSVPEGRQSSRGFEVELVWQVADGLTLLGSYSYVRTSYEDDLFAFVTGRGQGLPGIPRHSGRLWANYRFGTGWLDGLRVGAGLYAQDEALISLRNSFYADPYVIIDATATYAWDAISVDLAIKNVAGADYFERLNYLGGRVAPAAERSVYLGLAARF